MFWSKHMWCHCNYCATHGIVRRWFILIYYLPPYNRRVKFGVNINKVLFVKCLRLWTNTNRAPAKFRGNFKFEDNDWIILKLTFHSCGIMRFLIWCVRSHTFAKKKLIYKPCKVFFFLYTFCTGVEKQIDFLLKSPSTNYSV